MKFLEDAALSGTRITNDGYLVGTVRCARTGIQEYRGADFGLDVNTVRIFRPESEVFSKKSLATFTGKPVTDDHPDEPVTADNWKEMSVGGIGEDVLRDGEYIRVPITLMDAGIIKKVQAGKREISMGYEMRLDFTEGTTPAGEAYDAVMTDLVMNHLAIVDKGRAGPLARIGDSWGASPIFNDGKPTMTLKTIAVDGLSVETTDAGVQAIQKLQGDLKAAKDAAVDSVGIAAKAHDEAIAAKDAEIDAKDSELAIKDAEIKSLKDAQLDDAALDQRVADRAELIAKASLLVKDADFKGKSDLQIKTEAVEAVNDAEFVKGKSEAYISAAFDLAKIPGENDKVRDALKKRDVKTADANDNGQSAYEKRLNDAWKGGAK